MPQYYVIIDFETSSEADLKKCGMFRYFENHNTVPLCVSAAVVQRTHDETENTDASKVKINHRADLTNKAEIATFGLWIDAYVRDTQYKFVAHNAAFERTALYVFFGINIPFYRWVDTMAMAAYAGLPQNLEGACAELGLDVGKDTAGAELMKVMTRPRRRLVKDPAGLPDYWWMMSHEQLKAVQDATGNDTQGLTISRLMDYCDQDVRAETALFWGLPDLPRIEQDIWCLNEDINGRGVFIDFPLLLRLDRLDKHLAEKCRASMTLLTGGAVTAPTQTEKLKDFLAASGMERPESIAKDTIDELIAKAPNQTARAALMLRKKGNGLATKKLEAFREYMSTVDGRARGMLRYYGAKTGRFAGAGPQPHNMVRPTLPPDSVALATRLLRDPKTDNEAVELFCGPLHEVAPSCMRSLIRAPEDKALVSVDLSQIEARVLLWIAGDEDGLNVFRRGEDIYMHQAMKTTRPGEQADRRYGKVQVLGLGYGMGALRFQDMAASYGLTLNEDEAFQVVQAYRNSNPDIVGLWSDADMAIRQAIKNRDRYFTFGRVPMHVMCHSHGSARAHPAGWNCLSITLPSKRQLVYRNPFLARRADARIEDIYYEGPVGKTVAQIKVFGALIVENVTQAIARDVLCHGLLTAAVNGVKPVLHVHDEVLAEVDIFDASRAMAILKAAMEKTPLWAPNLPLASDGWINDFFRK